MTLIDLIEVTEYVNYHTEKSAFNTILKSRSVQLSRLILEILRSGSSLNWNIKELNEAIELSLNHKALADDEIDEIIKIMSPLEGKQTSFIADLYPSHANISTGPNAYRFSYNGLYQVLSYLYATRGNVEKTLQCTDTLRAYHENYEEYGVDGHTIGGYFMHYDRWEELNNYANLYSKRIGRKSYQFYEALMDRCPKISSYLIEKFKSNGRSRQNIWHNTVLEYQSIQKVLKLFDAYLNQIDLITQVDERNYAKAMFYKRKGTTLDQIQSAKGLKKSDDEVSQLFEKSIEAYEQVGINYLEEVVDENIYTQFKRRTIYKYPDYLETHRVYEFDDIIDYKTPSFINWIINTGRFVSFYSSIDELNQLNFWLSSNINNNGGLLSSGKPLDLDTFIKISKAIEKHPLTGRVDYNYLFLQLTNSYFGVNDTINAIKSARKINPSGFKAILKSNNWYHNSARFQYICNIYYNLITLSSDKL